MLRCLATFVLSLALAGAFQLSVPAARSKAHTIRMVAIGPDGDMVRQCLSEAENGAEAEECLLPMALNEIPTTKPLKLRKTMAEKRAQLLGPNESLDQCLSEAENAGEIQECRLDYDALVSSPQKSNMLTPIVLGLATAVAILQYAQHS